MPRQENNRADLLSKLASCTKPYQQRSVIKETLTTPRVEASELVIMAILEKEPGKDSWMIPIKTYLADGALQVDEDEA